MTNFAIRILSSFVNAATETPTTVAGRKALAKDFSNNGMEAKIVAGPEPGTKILVVKAKPIEIITLLQKIGKHAGGSAGAGSGPQFDVHGTRVEVSPGVPRMGRWAGYTHLYFPFKV